MSKKIIVAGAGHGGLSAAILLARSGYDVTVVEQKERSELMYKHSCFSAPRTSGDNDILRLIIIDDLISKTSCQCYKLFLFCLYDLIIHTFASFYR